MRTSQTMLFLPGRNGGKKKKKRERNLGLGEYWLQVKENLDVERDWELPDLSNAKMFSCGKKKNVGNSQLENYESYTGQLTSMGFFFFWQVLQGSP